MERRAIGRVSRHAPSRVSIAGLAAVALITAVASVATIWVGSPVACGGDAIAARPPASGEIARARPGRQAEAPLVPREALSETERPSEEVDPDGTSTYSWPQAIPAGRFGARTRAGRDFTPVITNASKAASSVDLCRLCRLLI